MRTNKSAPSGHLSALMDLPAARQQVSPRMRQIVLEWRRQHPTLLHKSAAQITFLDDFCLHRQENGCIELAGPYGHPYMPREADIGIDQFMDWLLPAATMKIRMLVLAELNQLTGRKSVNPLDLGALDGQCGELVHILAGERGLIGLKPIENEIHDFLDTEAWMIAHRARDTFTSLATYNTIAANRETWLSLEEQSPSLMPLLGYACRKKKIHFDQNALRSLKQYARRNGLTEAGWKALCTLSVEHVHHLLQYSLEDCFRMASHIGKTGLEPPISLIVRHIQDCQRRRVAIGTIPAWFDQAAIREVQRLQKEQFLPASTFINGDYAIALDWLADYMARGGRPDAHQKKAGWQWIRRQSDAWHEEQARKQVTDNYTWSTALDAYQDGGFDVVPLTSSIDLAVEGAEMRHCVGSYAGSCNIGRNRIFSIRKGGKRLATAELVYDNRSHAWSLNQNRGPYNRPPSPDIMAVARRLEEAYNAAVRLAASARESINRL
jgi:hypothetical protein